MRGCPQAVGSVHDTVTQRILKANGVTKITKKAKEKKAVVIPPGPGMLVAPGAPPTAVAAPPAQPPPTLAGLPAGVGRQKPPTLAPAIEVEVRFTFTCLGFCHGLGNSGDGCKCRHDHNCRSLPWFRGTVARLDNTATNQKAAKLSKCGTCAYATQDTRTGGCCGLFGGRAPPPRSPALADIKGDTGGGAGPGAGSGGSALGSGAAGSSTSPAGAAARPITASSESAMHVHT